MFTSKLDKNVEVLDGFQTAIWVVAFLENLHVGNRVGERI